MILQDAYNSLLASIAESFCDLAKNELLKCAEISNVRIALLNRIPFKAEAHFDFNDAKAGVFIAKEAITPMYSNVDITVKAVCFSIEKVIELLSTSYVEHLREKIFAVIDASTPPNLHRKQQVLYKQAQLVEAGFNVDISLRNDGEFYFSISHPKLGMLKRRLVKTYSYK